jgi:hypothetical protein
MKSRLGPTNYYVALAMLHEALKPRTYLEIGVASGLSMALAQSDTLCIGVDPSPTLIRYHTPPLPRFSVFEETSDSFFAGRDLETVLDGNPLDLAFIDGMHLFEYALRDFMNIEANSHSSTVLLLHDCLPQDEVTSSRRRTTEFWTGDVWKLVACLQKYRPDLDLTLTDAAPSGLCIVLGLDRGNRVIPDLYEQIVGEYAPLSWEFFETQAAGAFSALTLPAEEAIDRLSRLRNTGWSTSDSRVRHLAARLSELKAENGELRAQVVAQSSQLADVYASTSWRLTGPIRIAGRQIERLTRTARGRHGLT